MRSSIVIVAIVAIVVCLLRIRKRRRTFGDMMAKAQAEENSRRVREN